MKIKDEHVAYMKAAIDAYAETQGGWAALVEKYETGKHERSEGTKDLQKRFCFDMMFDARLCAWVCQYLYSYSHDEHIYTALKSICPKVTKRY